MKRLAIELGDRSYPVWAGAGLLDRAGTLLRRCGFHVSPILVSNPRVLGLHGRALCASLEDAFGSVPVIRIRDGERFKNHDTLLSIYEGLFRARADRHSWILAFGGGVVGDVAGFAAATYLRGIPYVGVPTTLLAQVDSSVGGKVGINAPRGKNLIGAFHQPAAVLSDTSVLKTLPPRELASGLYEIVKAAAIGSAPLLRYLERRLDAVLDGEAAAIEHVVFESVRIKAQVVAVDEREERVRMVLNLGHTLGHALEAATEYRRFKHGEAVAWGMIAAAGLSSEIAGLPVPQAGRLAGLIHRIERLPSLRGIPFAAVWDALRRDKKFADGRIRLVLLPELGRTEIVEDLEPARLRRFLDSFLARGGTLS